MKASFVLITGAVALGLVASGCKVQVGNDPDAAAQFKEGAVKAGEQISEVAKKAGAAAQKSASQASATRPVWYALSNSKDVDTSNLKVETEEHNIYLRGTVPTQEQKDKAVNMAKAIADHDYTVVDELKVQPKDAQKPPRISDDQKP